MNASMNVSIDEPIEVDSGYLLAAVHNAGALREQLAGQLGQADLLGTLIIAPEGLNWSLCGEPAALDCFHHIVHGIDLGGTVRHIRTPAIEPPFERLKLRAQPELVTSGLTPDTLPVTNGTHIAPEAFNALLDTPGLRLIDVRNRYEIEIGSFEQAENPCTEDFGGFVQFAEESLNLDDKSTPIALYCTGGVRCERASQLLLSKGFEQVYQLAGGILAYLKAVPPSEQRFVGECFVFDNRVSLTRELEPGNYRLNGAHIEQKRSPQPPSYSKSGLSASHTMSLITD